MIADLLLSPLTLAGAAGASLLLVQRARRGAPFVCAGAALAVAVLLMTPLVANLLVAAVERTGASAWHPDGVSCARSNPGTPPDIDAIVLLAGGFERPPQDPGDFSALSRQSLERAFALTRLPIDPDVDIIVVGGGPFAISEAEVIARLLSQLGFNPGRVAVETESRNTLENAYNAAAILLPERQRIALATDALHMSRAAFAFRRSGFELCRLRLASSYVPAYGLASLIPQAGALEKSRRALHEIAGTVYYRLARPFVTKSRNHQ